MKLMKTSFKNIFIVLSILISYIMVGYLYVSVTKQSLMSEKFHEVSINMKIKLQTLISEKKESVLIVALTLSQNNGIKEALLSKSTDDIKLSNFSSTLHRYSPLKNLWFQIVDIDGKSLYRIWTDKKGDNVLKSRKDIRKILKEPKVISLISTGKYNMTFKSIVPIYSNEKFIGIVETIAHFNSIYKKMSQNGYNMLTLIDKSYKKQLTMAKTKLFVDDYYLATKLYDKKLLTIFQKTDKEKLLSIPSYTIDKINNILITTYHLKDINNKEMGYFIISKNIKDINFFEIDERINNIILMLIFIASIVIGFSYYIYVIKYKKFIENQNIKLEKDVKFKTKELYYTAHHDALTGLPNRILFTDRLKESIKYAKRHNKNLFIMFLDLDRFKEVNDIYGHDIGDELLKVVAKRLERNLRDIDTIARLGGDEFTIIIEDISYNDMIMLAKKIISKMQKSVHIKGIELSTTFSIGISSYPTDGETMDELLKNADIAMYQAKNDGKNRYAFYNKEMSKIAYERLKLEQDIKSALINKEFEVYFQPKVNARTNTIIGLEALIRWNHPTKGLVFPDQFINFAEEVGLIFDIDAYMRKETMLITKQWYKNDLDFKKVSINVSTLELERKSFVSDLEKLINDIGYDTSKLELEILESQSIQDRESMIEVLKDIKNLGVSISIDDFGTGYSSLSYLKQLPVDKLKIDRSFIIDLPEDEAAVALVKTIIALAHNLKLELIAEGVDAQNQIDFLLKEGCEDIQGYYYSKPISKNDLEQLLINGL